MEISTEILPTGSKSRIIGPEVGANVGQYSRPMETQHKDKILAMTDGISLSNPQTSIGHRLMPSNPAAFSLLETKANVLIRELYEGTILEVRSSAVDTNPQTSTLHCLDSVCLPQ